jgi:hypothetical protein
MDKVFLRSNVIVELTDLYRVSFSTHSTKEFQTDFLSIIHGAREFNVSAFTALPLPIHFRKVQCIE